MITYQSNQVHTVQVNGKSSTRKNKVTIRNGKGTKSITTNGKTTSKPLTKKEIASIQQGKFIPNLFNTIAPRLNNTKRQRRNK